MKAAIPLTLPNVSERRHVHILNPASGGSRYFKAAQKAILKSGEEMLLSNKPGEIRRLVCELFKSDPIAHAVVYGGDGTVFEAINGIMDSGMSEFASFSVVPSGSGNDFSKYVNDSNIFRKADLNKIDIVHVTCGEKSWYYANMMNIGFDCSVVNETYELKKKPLLHGSAAYIAGVLKVLAVKKTFRAKIEMQSVVGNLADNGDIMNEKLADREILLCAVANSRYCGGGFNAAPLAKVDDGYLDTLIINDVTRMKFMSLIGDYRAGTYIDGAGKMKEKFDGVLDYERCEKMSISGADMICLDGEIFHTKGNTLTAEIVKNAIWFAAL